MNSTIARLGQDLARAEYAKTTQSKYVAAAKELGQRFGRPIEDITRDEVREFVDEVMARDRSASTKRHVLSGIRFLYARTLGRPEMVSFFRMPREHSPLPTVLSLAEVKALLQAIRHPRYQAMANHLPTTTRTACLCALSAEWPTRLRDDSAPPLSLLLGLERVNWRSVANARSQLQRTR